MSALVFRKLRIGTTLPGRRPRGDVAGFRAYRATDGFEAIVPNALAERMLTMARRAAPKECAALLAVRRFVDSSGAYVTVEGIVPFEYVEASEASVATTVESERVAREQLTALFPDVDPGAWFHSHPGWGLFFSETDRVTQRTWVAQNSLGLVVDPTIPDRLFVVRGPESEELSLVAAATERPRRKSKRRAVVAAVLAVLMGAGFMRGVLGFRRTMQTLHRMDARVAALEARSAAPGTLPPVVAPPRSEPRPLCEEPVR